LSLFVLIGYTLKNSYEIQEDLLFSSLKNKAITIFNLIVDMRHWNAQFEGVYVKADDLAPNPHLNPGYINSEDGSKLVWINPAFMTRQISNIASQRDGFSLKITSNKLINENNAPTKFEKEILDYFDKNPSEPYYWEIKGNEFKFMGALVTQKECLACHAKQGYEIGDIRGGISVSFDINNEINKLDVIKKDNQQTILFLVIASIGAIITLLIYERTKKLHEEKISRLNESLELKVLELDEFNKNLESRVQNEVFKQREKENMLIQQSKLAALGEMIGNIAHQWRQPISAVSAIMMNIKWTAISAGIDRKFIDERMYEANDQLKYMSQTIDDFRSFFKPNKGKEIFILKDEITKAYKITQATLENYNINIKITACENISAYGYANEFSQVVLNLISNAKDVLIQKQIVNPKIEINISEDEKNVYCEVTDNAGGINDSIINKIFEPYFTTKENSGTGIGLYISKEIIEKHMQGSLSVENIENGAKFKVSISKVYNEA
jgi:signal transduction histidine kinase